MEATAPQTVVGQGAPRGYRGRGAGAPSRGGFERGRGRGMGRGHYMGGLGRGGPSGMISTRGMRPPRGGPGGYQGRGGYLPRGSGGLNMRGGRPPLYAQPPKQHTGAENNKTVSPVPTSVIATVPITDANAAVEDGSGADTSAEVESGLLVNPSHTAVHSNGTAAGVPPPSRGGLRGRGGPLLRGGGRGGYNPYSNGIHGGYSGMLSSYGGGEHGSMPMRRGGPPRGRGGYGASMTRPPIQHSANTQIAPVPSLKRGALGGAPGPKRGRYEHGPYSRPMAPKYQHSVQHVHAMPSHQTYGPPQHHPQQHSHHAYASHEQSQPVDPYAQSYAAPAVQNSYNGYGQSAYGAAAAVPTNNTGYAQQATEYDQNQYQGYSSASYGTQQDTRYSTYGQDYTQQYGAPAIDYNSTTQADYSQHGQSYDERAYAGYDSQAYQQTYSNAAGYY